MSASAFRSRGPRSLPSRFLIAAILLAPSTQLLAREITFAQRVEAQRAIERVYHIHRSGGVRGFEAAVPDALLVEKVRTYLAESVALEEVWRTPITATMLRREVERMTAGSRLPERLSEIRAALENDDRLLAETLARATLVDRRCRQLFAADTRFASTTWKDWRQQAERGFDPVRARRTIEEAGWDAGVAPDASGAAAAASCAFEDLWGSGGETVIPESHAHDAAVWTGAELIVWGGPSQGARYDATTDSWTPTDTNGAPAARLGATAIWTGSEMIVWGGDSSGAPVGTGGRYRPLTDTWAPVSSTDAPSAREGHTAVWTGSEMIVWGGSGTSGRLADGGRYDPGTDTWLAVPTGGAPAPRNNHTAVWTGHVMVIWGGELDGDLLAASGGRFDPGGARGPGSWDATSTAGAPAGRTGHTAVWTGAEMIVWGGGGVVYIGPSGGRYDPVGDHWASMSLGGAPSYRIGHEVVWTGAEMIVWGGFTTDFFLGFVPLDTGGRYSPASDTWTPTTMTGRPGPRAYPLLAWTGRAMLVWDGECWCGDLILPIRDASMHWYGNAVADAPADRDGDGVSECDDCDDQNLGAWGVPGEVTGLTFDVDDVTLSWSPPVDPGAASVSYDLLRSNVASNFQSAAVCLDSGIAAPGAADTAAPSLNKFFYYLARARNACPGGIGTVGAGSSGVPRAALVCP